MWKEHFYSEEIYTWKIQTFKLNIDFIFIFKGPLEINNYLKDKSDSVEAHFQVGFPPTQGCGMYVCVFAFAIADYSFCYINTGIPS